MKARRRMPAFTALSDSMAIVLAAFSLIRLWTGTSDHANRSDLAALVPVAYWGSFFPAVLVRGTGYDDEAHRGRRIVGILAEIFYAGLTASSAIGERLFDRRSCQ